MKKIQFPILLMVPLAIFGFCSYAAATEFAIDIVDIAVIFNPDANEAQRALFQFDLPQDFSNKSVKSAKLCIYASVGLSDSSSADLTVWPLATLWNADDVGWNSPWTQPGGDFADSSYALLPTSDGTLRVIEIDISSFAAAWAKGWYANNGIMLVLFPSDQFTYELESNNDWGGYFARVEIVYGE